MTTGITTHCHNRCFVTSATYTEHNNLMDWPSSKLHHYLVCCMDTLDMS